MYIRSQVGGTWSEWKKICGTSIADVSNKVIANFNDETKYAVGGKTNNRYSVVNGECELDLFVKTVSPATGFVEVYSGLPKPITTKYFLLGEWSSLKNDYMLVQLKPNGSLLLMKGTANGTYLGSFKYKVAE